MGIRLSTVTIVFLLFGLGNSAKGADPEFGKAAAKVFGATGFTFTEKGEVLASKDDWPKKEAVAGYTAYEQTSKKLPRVARSTVLIKEANGKPEHIVRIRAFGRTVAEGAVMTIKEGAVQSTTRCNPGLFRGVCLTVTENSCAKLRALSGGDLAGAEKRIVACTKDLDSLLTAFSEKEVIDTEKQNVTILEAANRISSDQFSHHGDWIGVSRSKEAFFGVDQSYAHLQLLRLCGEAFPKLLEPVAPPAAAPVVPKMSH